MIFSISRILLLLGFAFTSIQAQLEDEYIGAGGFGGNPLDDYNPEAAFAPLKELETETDLQEFINPKDEEIGGGVVAVFSKAAEEVRSDFETLVKPINGKGLRFATTSSKALMDKFTVSPYGWKIFVFPPPQYLADNEKSKYRFGGTEISTETGKTSLRAFIIERYLPSVMRISPSAMNERLFIERRLPVFVVLTKFDQERDPKGAAYILNRVRKIAEKFHDKLVFAILDMEDSEGTQFFQRKFFVAEDSQTQPERIVGIKDDNRYYTMKDSFSVQNGEDFVSKFLANELNPYSIQEPPLEPEEDELAKLMAGARDDYGLPRDAEEL